MWSRNKERSLWQNYWSLAAAALHRSPFRKCRQNDGLFTELLASRTKAKCDAPRESSLEDEDRHLHWPRSTPITSPRCVLIRDVRSGCR